MILSMARSIVIILFKLINSTCVRVVVESFCISSPFWKLEYDRYQFFRLIFYISVYLSKIKFLKIWPILWQVFHKFLGFSRLYRKPLRISQFWLYSNHPNYNINTISHWKHSIKVIFEALKLFQKCSEKK